MDDIKRLKTSTGWLVVPSNSLQPAKLSDQELYGKCREYGMNTKLWNRRFAGLLPEVCRRNLHRRKGFLSIQEFAAKLAGMSEYAVDRILSLSRKLEDKPVLRELFESGSEGWSKIATVAYIATAETEELWAEKVKALSRGALELYVRNYRFESVPGDKQNNFRQIGQASVLEDGESAILNASGFSNSESILGVDAFPAGDNYQEPVRFSCPVDRTVEFDLRLAKQNLEKNTHQALTWNEAFGLLIKENKRAKEQKCFKCTNRNGVIKVCENCARRLKCPA